MNSSRCIYSYSAEIIQTCIDGFLGRLIAVIFFAFFVFSVSDPDTLIIIFVSVKARAGHAFVAISTSLRFQFVKACWTSGNDSL